MVCMQKKKPTESEEEETFSGHLISIFSLE